MTKKMEVSLEPVKRLLRRRNSPRYYKGGTWTENVEEAETFTDMLEAIETCVHGDLKDVELVLRIGNARCDIFCTGIR